jgi:hypothetical protein
MESLSCILPDALYLAEVRNDPYDLSLPFFLPSQPQNERNPRFVSFRLLQKSRVDSVIEPKLLAQHKITHIASILQDLPSESPLHLSIHLDNEEMDPVSAILSIRRWLPEVQCSYIALVVFHEVQVVLSPTVSTITDT